MKERKKREREWILGSFMKMVNRKEREKKTKRTVNNIELIYVAL